VHRASHDSDVLCHVLFAHEVAHVVFVSHVIILILLLLPLLDLSQLPTSQLRDLTEDLCDAFAFRLNSHATKLVLHLFDDSVRPASDLVVDQLHVLLALLETLKVDLEMLAFSLQVGVFGLLSLHRVIRIHEFFHLVFIGLVGVFVLRLRPDNIPSILVRDL